MGAVKPILAGGCCCAVFVAAILILSSLSVLRYDEVGLNYSNWFKTVEDKTYESGIHFIGLGRDFITYKLSLQTTEFVGNNALKPRTKDGLEVSIEISLQYRVIPEEIYTIYTKFGENEKKIMNRKILDAVADVATTFSSQQYFSEREAFKQ